MLDQRQEDKTVAQGTLTAARTTLLFACWNCGVTRSQICSASFSSTAVYSPMAERSDILPHSVHSPRATSSFDSRAESRTKISRASEAFWISQSAVTALEMTCAANIHTLP